MRITLLSVLLVLFIACNSDEPVSKSLSVNEASEEAENIDEKKDGKELEKDAEADKEIIDAPEKGANQVITEGLDEFKMIPIPANPGEDMTWAYDAYFSDDFNYNFNSSSRAQFGKNNQWTNWYHSNWNGPGLTLWDEDNVHVNNSHLRLITTRVPGEMETYSSGGKTGTGKATRLGCISTNKQLVYPVYIETRAKIPNTVNACAAWLLSPDGTQEIDFMEAWGAKNNSRNTGNGNGSGRELWESVHLSHHVFIRKPFTDYQPKTDTHFKRSDVQAWTDDYHTYGVYWKTPTELYYYVDGKLARTIKGMDNANGKDGIDPKGHTGVVLINPNNPRDGAKLDANGKPVVNMAARTGLNKPMNIIIDMEDQDWRAAIGATPTDSEILNKEDHTLKVDWIRVYKPVSK